MGSKVTRDTLEFDRKLEKMIKGKQYAGKSKNKTIAKITRRGESTTSYSELLCSEVNSFEESETVSSSKPSTTLQ